jgi:TonB family protein
MMELSVIAKATVILGLALSVAATMRRARASVRALILAAAFGALLMIPIAAIVIPPVTVTIPVSHATTRVLRPPDQGAPSPSSVGYAQGASDAVRSSSRVRRLSVGSVLRAVWITGVIVFLLPMVTMVWRLRGVERTGVRLAEESRAAEAFAAEAGIRREIAVLGSGDVTVPVTYGVLRSIVVMPSCSEQWTPDDVRRALIHEIEHVRRADWPVQLAARTACAIYWFHPLAWMAWRRLRLECERACDDAVVQASDETAYAEQLVTLARRLSAKPIAALSMANRSDLAARVSAVLDVGQRRGRAGIACAAITVSAAAALLLAIAPLHAVATPDTTVPTTRGLLVRDRQGTGTISGYVFDPLGGTVDNLQIILENSPNIGFGYGDVVWTDANGRFTFTKIPAGSFFLSAALDYFPPITVRLDDGEDIEQDVRMAIAPLIVHYVICADCPASNVAPFMMPESLRKEFERDREAAWNSPVVGPAPVGGWEFDQPQRLEYPAALKESGLSGTVTIEGRVGTDGFATALRVVSGHPDLARAAVALVKEQQWEPARVRGLAVDVPLRVEVEYVRRAGS